MDNQRDFAAATNQLSSSKCLKRKRINDDGEVLLRHGPLTEEPIENEYEHFDDDEDIDDEVATQLKRKDFEEMVKAQEPSTVQQYDDIKITPFNLEEELEDGNFDEAGNFIFSKRQKDTEDNPNDNWAETVDWASVEQTERERKEAQSSVRQKPVDEEMPQVKERHTYYGELLDFMLPSESVQQAIRRLGRSIPKRQSSKHKSKSSSTKLSQQGSEIDIKEARRKLENVIELAHQLLEDGDVDIYQKSFQDIKSASVGQT